MLKRKIVFRCRKCGYEGVVDMEVVRGGSEQAVVGWIAPCPGKDCDAVVAVSRAKGRR